MANRSVGSAVISYGVLAIPVKLYISASAESVSFNMITKKGNRVKQKLEDAVTGEEIDRKDTLKGYEHTKGQFVTFTEEEVKAMHAEKTDRMDITEFAPLNTIDLLQVEKNYYLGPDKGGDLAYAMLAKALHSTNKVAVATWGARGKEHLMVLRAYKDGIVAHQMYYSTEVRSFDCPVAKLDIPEKMLKLTECIIENEAVEVFDNTHYFDRFAARVNDAVCRKLAGEEIVVPASANAPILKLEDALASMLERSKSKKVQPKTDPKTIPSTFTNDFTGNKTEKPKKKRAAGR